MDQSALLKPPFRNFSHEKYTSKNTLPQKQKQEKVRILPTGSNCSLGSFFHGFRRTPLLSRPNA